MFDRLAAVVLTHRALFAAGLLVVLGIGLAGAASLRTDFSALAFYGSGDPEVDRLLAYKERWGKDDAMLLAVLSPAEGTGPDMLTEPRLRAVAALMDTLDSDPGIAWAQAITSTPLLAGGVPGLLDLTTVGELLDDGDGPALKARILADPLVVPQLVAPDGGSLAVFVELAVDPDDVDELRPAVFALRDRMAEWTEGRDAGIAVGTAGVPAVRADFFQLILSDQLVTVPLLALVLTLILFAIFRRPHGVMAPGIAAAVPAVLVFGAMGWAGESIGILNQSYFTLLPVIAVADAIHMVSRFHEEVRRHTAPGAVPSAEARRAAIRAAMSAIGRACLLTSLTTAVGFGSLGMANMPILRSFGGFAALGIAFAYGTVLLVIPLVLSLSRGAVPEAGREEDPTPVDRLLLRCADVSIRRPWVVLAAFGVLMAASLGFGSRVRVDNTLTGLIGPSHPTRIAGAIADDNLGGILGAEIEFEGPPGSMDRPEVLGAMLAIEEWALAQPEARASVSPARWVATLSEALTGRPGLPETKAGVAQMRLLAEGDERQGRMISLDGARARLTIRTRDDGGNAFADFTARLAATVDEALTPLAAIEGLGAVEGHVTGTPHVAYRGINAVTSDLRDSLLLALVAVTAIIGALFRSVRVALLALLPNAMPLVVGYGLMGLMDWELDPTPAVVFTVALGIAVDDTIHLLVRARDEQALGRSLHEALRAAVLHSGRAVTITTVLLCVGFGLNGLSSFPSMQVLAAVGATVIFVALLGDLFLLPALLVVAGRRTS